MAASVSRVRWAARSASERGGRPRRLAITRGWQRPSPMINSGRRGQVRGRNLGSGLTRRVVAGVEVAGDCFQQQ
jgi:hypothetical protein